MNQPKAMVAMSGGVDSSVAVALLQEAGYWVEGITMFLGDQQVVEKAQEVAAAFGIPHHVLNLEADFQKEVQDYFAASYQQGTTPNPCVVCNQKIKMGKLFRHAMSLGCQYFATGHYATVQQIENRFAIGRGSFLPKDQSYVLFTLGQEVLSRLILPLGGLSKDQVRAKAAAMGLGVANQKDSQDICFIPDGDYRGFLTAHGVRCQQGDFVDKWGNVLGRHQGIVNYTVGQRKGLGVSFGHPMFVTAIRPQTNQVVLGLEPDLFSTGFITTNNNLMLLNQLTEPMGADIKVRYKSPAVPGIIRPYSGALEPDIQNNPTSFLVEVLFDQPQKAITPGQAGVFYLDDLVLGGGIILTSL